MAEKKKDKEHKKGKEHKKDKEHKKGKEQKKDKEHKKDNKKEHKNKHHRHSGKDKKKSKDNDKGGKKDKHSKVKENEDTLHEGDEMKTEDPAAIRLNVSTEVPPTQLNQPGAVATEPYVSQLQVTPKPIPPIQKYTIDLTSLTQAEEAALTGVLDKEEQEQRRLDARVSVVHHEIQKLRESIQKGIGLENRDRKCKICQAPLRGYRILVPFVDHGRKCQRCLFWVCLRHRMLQANGHFMCYLCARYREEKWLTGEWAFKGCAGLQGSDLIRASLRDKEYYQRRRDERKQRLKEQLEMRYDKAAAKEPSPEAKAHSRRPSQRERKKSKKRERKDKKEKNNRKDKKDKKDKKEKKDRKEKKDKKDKKEKKEKKGDKSAKSAKKADKKSKNKNALTSSELEACRKDCTYHHRDSHEKFEEMEKRRCRRLRKASYGERNYSVLQLRCSDFYRRAHDSTADSYKFSNNYERRSKSESFRSHDGNFHLCKYDHGHDKSVCSYLDNKPGPAGDVTKTNQHRIFARKGDVCRGTSYPKENENGCSENCFCSGAMGLHFNDSKSSRQEPKLEIFNPKKLDIVSSEMLIPEPQSEARSKHVKEKDKELRYKTNGNCKYTVANGERNKIFHQNPADETGFYSECSLSYSHLYHGNKKGINKVPCDNYTVTKPKKRQQNVNSYTTTKSRKHNEIRVSKKSHDKHSMVSTHWKTSKEEYPKESQNICMLPPPYGDQAYYPIINFHTVPWEERKDVSIFPKKRSDGENYFLHQSVVSNSKSTSHTTSPNTSTLLSASESSMTSSSATPGASQTKETSKTTANIPEISKPPTTKTIEPPKYCTFANNEEIPGPSKCQVQNCFLCSPKFLSDTKKDQLIPDGPMVDPINSHPVDLLSSKSKKNSISNKTRKRSKYLHEIKMRLLAFLNVNGSSLYRNALKRHFERDMNLTDINNNITPMTQSQEERNKKTSRESRTPKHYPDRDRDRDRGWKGGERKGGRPERIEGKLGGSGGKPGGGGKGSMNRGGVGGRGGGGGGEKRGGSARGYKDSQDRSSLDPLRRPSSRRSIAYDPFSKDEIMRAYESKPQSILRQAELEKIILKVLDTQKAEMESQKAEEQKEPVETVSATSQTAHKKRVNCCPHCRLSIAYGKSMRVRI